MENVTPRALTDQEIARLAELDEAIGKFEGQKRWSDVIKSILAKAEIVQERDERVALLTQAGAMYLEKSSNQAEAIKCFEQVIELDDTNVGAMAQLKEMYEKRRDWEKLVRVMEREAALLDPSDRGFRYVEMAQLATERLRKPEICIDLWRKVLSYEGENAEALGALAGLYERAREWAPLAEVLEKQSTSSAGDERKQLLAKLGTIYADKLADDRGAVSAFQRLLEVDPEDKRAQEQLKRRYVSIKAWDELEAFYAPSGKWDELIRTLEREAANKEAPKEEQIDLSFRIAKLWARLDKADRAARAYERVLELDPTNLDAAVSLGPIYEAVGDAKKLAGVLEVRLQHVDEAEERMLLLRETGLLYEERLKRPDAAFAKYTEALALDPMREVLREDASRLAPAVGGWDSLVATYATAVEARADVAEQIDLRLQLGGIFVATGRSDDAIQQFERVLADEPMNGAALAALDGLYRGSGRFDDLLANFDRRLELESDTDARKRVAYARAALLDDDLGRADAAIDAYQSIITEWGDDEADAYAKLDRLLEKQGRWTDLATALERRIDLGPASEEELAALKFRLARVVEGHLDDRARALELYREVITILPEHDGARDALEGFLPDPALGADAAQLLEPIYEVRGDWEALIRSLEVLVRGAGDAERKLELLMKIGEVHGAQVGDPRRSFEAYLRALEVAPEHATALERVHEIASARGWQLDRVRHDEALAQAASDADLARRLWIRAAGIHDGELSSLEGAVAAYQKVLDADPNDPEVLDALEQLYTRHGKHRELLGVLRKKVGTSADPSEQEELLARIAEIHDARLGEPQQAIDVYREILALDASSRRGLSALDTLLAREQRWSDLADNVQRQLDLATDPDEQTSLMLRLAELRETRMGAPDAAVEIHRDVLARDPENAAALGALERLLDRREHQLAITDILEPIYRDANEFGKLIGVLEIQTQHATSPDRRVELLHRIAELSEVALDDTGRAFGAMTRALVEEPSNGTTHEALERLAAAMGDFDRLARVFEERSEALAGVGDDESRQLANALLTRAAEVRESQLGDSATAIRHYQTILSRDAAGLDAISSLERLYQETEQYESLAATLLQKAEIVDDAAEKRGCLGRAAAIFEEILERPLDAIRVHEQVVALDGEDHESLDKLVELNLRLERWPELLDVYNRKADVVSDLDLKKQLYSEVGAVYERELGQPAKAVDTYQRILEIDPDDLTAIQRLDALYQASGSWQELRQILEREAELAADPSEIVSYKYRVADLWHHPLADATKAVEGYAEILEAAPDHAPTLSALEAMIQEGKEPLRAATTLEPVYQQFGEWQRLVAVLEVQAREESEPARKVELLQRIAELAETQIDDANYAFEAYARALPLESANEQTLASLERLAGDLNSFPRVAALYDAELARLGEQPERVVELGIRTAQIYEVQVGDVESAIARYTQVLAADDTNTDAIEALDRLYEATESWEHLAGILGRESQLASTPDQSLEFQFRLGQTYEHRIGRVSDAIAQYKEILDAAPEHAPALQALEELFAAGVQPLEIAQILEPLYRMSEAWDRLVGVYQVQLEQVTEPSARLAMIHRIAEIAEDRAAEPQIAFEWHQRALFEAPLDEQSIADSERLAGALGTWEQLADSLAVVCAQHADVAVQVASGHRLARIYEEQLSDVQRAAATHLFVLGVAPGDGESLDALDRIFSEHGAAEALQSILARRVEVESEPRAKVEFAFRRGQVLENDLGRIDDAVAVYQHVVGQLDAEHEASIRALSGIYSEAGDFTNLYATFEKELGVALGDSGRADVLAKMARVASDYLAQDDRAVTLWKEVLELRGEDVEALSALGDLHAKAGRFDELLQTLDREAIASTDDPMRVAIFSDMARVAYGKLQNAEVALENWRRVLEVDPANTGAFFGLIEIQRAAGDVPGLIESLQRVIEIGATQLDDPTVGSCTMELAALYESIEQPADAIESYNNALDIDAANFAAMEALERLHAASGDWVEQIQVYERRADALERPTDKVACLLAIADAWTLRVGDADRATSAYQRVLGLDPTHVEAFDSLEKLHRAAGRWDELVDLYITRHEHVEDTPTRVSLLRRMASVQENELADPAQAYDALTLAWEQDYTDKQTVAELERITASTQRWRDLLTTANAALPQVTDRSQKIALLLACARWYAGPVNHPDYAIPFYQQVYSLDPTNAAAMRQLADMHRSTAQWQTLEQDLKRLIAITPSNSDKAPVFVELGELAAQHLGQPGEARNYFLRALDADAKCVPALEALERVSRDSGDWPQYVEMVRRKADALTDPEAIIRARLQIAEAHEERTGLVDEAIAANVQALQLDPNNLRAMKGLERLYARKEMWPDLLQVLERQYDVVTTEKERIQILLRVAGMWEEEFVKPERAAERLEKVVEIDPANDTAYRSLARIYRGMKRWDLLVGTLERHISATSDRTEKQGLLASLGEVHANELNDTERAIDDYLSITSINADNQQALDALTRLYDRRGEHSQALDTMMHLARLLREPEQVVDLRFRMGKLLDEKLGDRASAVDQYQAALDVDPGHQPSLEAMRKIHLDGGDWLAAARALEQETQSQQQPRVVSRLLVELGRLYDEKLDEHDRAIEVYEAALRQDSDNEDAAYPLAFEYASTGRAEEALPLFDALVKRSAKRSPEEQQRLAFMLGDVASKTGSLEVATKALARAYQLDGQHLPTLMSLSNAYFQTQNWEQAFRHYQIVLAHHRDDITQEQLTDLFFRLGVIKREQGDRRKALNMFDKALEETATHRPTLEAVVSLYEQQNDWEQVIHFKKQILDQASSDERFAMLNEIGDLWNDKVKNPARATEAFYEALELRPSERPLLHKLLAVHQATKQWDNAVEIIERISQLVGESDQSDEAKASQRAKYTNAIATIVRDEIKDTDRALIEFDRTLDFDPTYLKAFESINKILTQRKDWKALERAFRKMVKRISGKTFPGNENRELEHQLWHNLGVIYRDRLKQLENSIECFKLAVSIRPESELEHRILAELYTTVPGRVDDAIGEQHWLLAQDPLRVEPYQALYKLYFEARQYDKAWCLAAALSYFQKADAEQRGYYEQYKLKTPIQPTGRLDDERWFTDLAHPDAELAVGKIFAQVWVALLSLKGQPDTAAGLEKKYLVDPATSTAALPRTFAFVSQRVLGLPTPRLFLRQDVASGLTHRPVWPLASLCGQALLSGFQPVDLLFVAGRHLADYRPEYYIRTLLPSNTELKVVLLASLRIAGLIPAGDPAVEQWAGEIRKHLQQPQIDAIGTAGRRFIAAGARTDVKKWLQGVELTACRAGFLACNELETASRMINALGPAGPVDVPPRDKMKDIITFSVSENYFRIRKALGIRIPIDTSP